ncbi:hypothetical protein DAPPUDRAFT_111093 [Daphnia pulex]|uniref:K Homology domain-containing protein n=1 Tax=Daphnia pulex TaxID=6669 RepID=E9H832_DAPPU|nr:hypothetical protein DAPPUDRAFT_111093 [Daphnia pulex]|eukprot:EFX72141.1 hypothetical protein DAPPUDRAFT_111093 [Daphnia pulex]
MDFFSRMTESQTRRSAVNLNKIKPDVACSNQHALPRPVINDGFSTSIGEDLSNQSFLRLMATVEEKNLIALENQRLANELSLAQSQLTDSSSKLQMFQNVHDELATTKSQLEEKESLIFDMTEKNLSLTNENSRLRRKIDRDRLLESSRAIEKKLMLLNKERLVNHVNVLQTQLKSNSNLQMFQNLHIELAKTKSKLEKQNSLITDMTEKNLRLANDDSRLRRKVEDRDRLIASSQAEVEALQYCLDEQKLDKVHDMLAISKRELELRNRSVTRLHKQNLRLMRNDKQLRRKLDSTNRFLESSRAESEHLRTCLAEQQLDKVHEDLALAKRELELRNRAVTRLEKKTFRLMRNDKRLRRKMKNTNSLLLSGQAELKNLRVCIAEQQLDTRELAKATRELESKNKTISELEAKNFSSAKNDSQLGRIEEPSTPVINLTEIETALKSLEKEKDEALQKLAEMENNQKGMKPKLTVGVGCGSNEEVFSQLQIEEPIIPPVTEITEILTPFLACNSTAVQAKSSVTEPQPLVTDAMENTPAQTFNEKKAVKQSTKQPQAALPEFSITTTIEKEVYVDRIVVTGIANKDCGRVVGRHGSNAKRIEEEYWVSVYFINGYLFITGGDAESRLAACSDIIDNLPVTIECPKINLRRNIFYEDYLLRELAFNHNVQIYRPCQENKYVTIWGTLANCKRVYAILQNGTR